MSNISKQGIVKTNEIIESDAMNEFDGGDYSYTPSTGQNSCMNIGKWMVPETASAGDLYRLQCDVIYSGFDRSNTSGTFSMWWQGAVYDKTTSSWKWAGNNPITAALNGQSSPTTVVLTATSGIYHYDVAFAIPTNNITTYTGMNIDLRSDYSNGTGKITLKNMKVIPEKYSTTSTPPLPNYDSETIILQQRISSKYRKASSDKEACLR